MQRFWVQSFPDPGRRRIKWRPADRVGYETRPTLWYMYRDDSVRSSHATYIHSASNNESHYIVYPTMNLIT